MVRLEALNGIQTLYFYLKTRLGCTTGPSATMDLYHSLLEPNLLVRLVKGVIKQTVEKIDKVRGIAGIVLTEMIELLQIINTKYQINIPDLDLLEKIGQVKTIDWSSTTEGFEVLIPTLIQSHVYRYSLLEGVVSSIGGLSSNILYKGFELLLSSIQSEPVYTVSSTASIKTHVTQNLYQLTVDYLYDEYYILPLYNTISKLSDRNALDMSYMPLILHQLSCEVTMDSKDTRRVP